ncbi:MAG: type I DNA topoisomerase [Chloroflexi bacterium]|nr:type I DNA topoisomerase [Chloroflexota bacterium]
MAKKLVIVESPAKAKTINKYLGKDFQVMASVGHVRDLPPKELGVDVEHGFRPTYHITRGKGQVLKEIAEAAQTSEQVYLATDPDREGEAIAWHVTVGAHIDEAKVRRITFDQVTKAAVQRALENPRALDRNLIDAQQARRVLDRLVGYKISPLLSKTMRKALSAGRVQSVALRLVVEREREILAFVPEEYWTLDADLQRRTPEKERFRARLLKIGDQDPGLSKKDEVDAILGVLEKATYRVVSVKCGTRRRNPSPPFITTTMQSEAGNKLGYSPRQTMALAQQLYEGVDLEGERVGLITYMRTDSPHVAPEAQAEAREYILQKWGQDYLPTSPPIYRSRTINAQEAHEAIRPTSVWRTPDSVRPYLDARQARLYELIWRRFLASQMVPAVYDTMTADITAAKIYLFRATGSVLRFPGFLVLYDEAADTDESQDLPALVEGEIVDLLTLLPEQHFTQPPPRYSEPTLIRELEANGVGRPSTYATIISVIQDRGYVIKEGRQLVPTALGMIVCDALVDTFARIMDVGYTAEMEERLDRIASGDLEYVAMLSGFYGPFQEDLRAAEGRMPQAVREALWRDLPDTLRERTCPQCGRPLEVRVSEAGKFLGCSGYPDCRYILDLNNPEKPEEPQESFAEGEFCAKCGGRMKIIERGRNKFLGCENYPRCKNTRPILSARIKELAAETACPDCGHKPLEARKGRYGEYLHCPHCDKNHSLRKLAQGGEGAVEKADVACPECGASPLEKRQGRYGPYYHCPACGKNISEKKMGL